MERGTYAVDKQMEEEAAREDRELPGKTGLQYENLVTKVSGRRLSGSTDDGHNVIKLFNDDD